MSLSDCRPEQHFLVTLGIFSFLPARKLCLVQLEEIIRGGSQESSSSPGEEGWNHACCVQRVQALHHLICDLTLEVRSIRSHSFQ